MANQSEGITRALKGIGWPLRLTRWGMVAERLTRAFWPLWSLLFAGAGALLLGLHEALPLELLWIISFCWLVALVLFTARGLRRFHWPTLPEAEARLDASLPGRPLAALKDTQAIGAGDAASEAVWQAHVARMAAKLEGAKAAEPDLRMASRDPYALRYVALLVLLTGLLFGSFLKVASVGEMAPGAGGDGLAAAGPSWEGWIEPPRYTGLPSLYLNDLPEGEIVIPQGSTVTLRLYGEVGALTVAETISGRTEIAEGAAEPAQSFTVTASGALRIDGEGGAQWDVTMTPDTPPRVEVSGLPEDTLGGELRQPFIAEDDYGVVAGRAVIALDMAALDRRYGLSAAPEPREDILLDLPLTISGDRAGFEETLVDTFAEHPWAGLPVTLTLEVDDALGQTGQSEAAQMALPGRRFFDPMAAALIEQRRDLLWTRENAPRVVQLLKAVTYKPEGLFAREADYLKLRVMMRRLETATEAGLTVEERDDFAQVLWDLAVQIEDGDLSDALERLRRAQDRLSQAMRDGATDQEIAELMQELREAMQDYMRQLAEQAQEGGEQQQAENGQSQEITGDQLQDMLDQIQELMEQGRMAEAQQLLDQLRQMMENMQVTQGGQGQQSPGQEAMEGLADTLRQQQGLSDEAFRDLQEQFNPNAQAGQSQQNEGRNGSEGRGQSHEGQGQGQGQGEQQGEGGEQQQADGQQGEQGGDMAGNLADRQQALRNELNRQQQNLPGAGTPEGDAAREALGRAGDAMDGAEEALRQDDLPEALDRQAEAMEALREGMRNLGDAMAQQQQQQGGQQGEAMGNAQPNNRDPLGRDAGSMGNVGTDEDLLQGEDVYRRARDLLDALREKSGEQERPSFELDYFKRLLDRF
ncbi:TIGR02302 family protein [Pseudoruegeria sp. SHC-113]|uniref:TIGR02302 family protein n=1 Tax=Pseudoruegeria sp. SHC-113 TaxID=2855439 RepID=UPI0021BB82C5|nr:TIGR02302 family protein [Pseudoruegeria sp. SHC-113]MCT8158958.1 TIGR02302 family protein [Pseudoruegeria sp. SHC-113]